MQESPDDEPLAPGREVPETPATLHTRRARLAASAHALPALWIGALLLAARVAPDRYWAAMQEDRVIEWWTALLFLAAFVLAIPIAVRQRRLGDALVALFCLFVAGEEVSWGQRFIGYTPPSAFLEHNTQQEFTVHNFREILGQPKWILAGILAAYGVMLPLLARGRLGRRLLDVVRLTPPPAALAHWFAAAVVLLWWYPVEFTGEWVETLAGGLFLASLGTGAPAILCGSVAALVAATALAYASARRGTSPELIACARAEVEAIASHAVDAATVRLHHIRRVHKRVWTAARDGYLEWDHAGAFMNVACAPVDDGGTARRRQYAVDPWGTAYWIVSQRGQGERAVVVYSFGPNRRRDGDPGVGGGDDILAHRQLPQPP
jgi:hypothetical protein